MVNEVLEVNGRCFEPHKDKTIDACDVRNHVTKEAIKRIMPSLVKAKKMDSDPTVSLHKMFDKYPEHLLFRSNIYKDTVYCVPAQGRYPFSVLSIKRDRYMVVMQSPYQKKRMLEIQARLTICVRRTNKAIFCSPFV
eukprot:Nk52_evm3s1916 gene=Nk52_evmTU3s1916